MHRASPGAPSRVSVLYALVLALATASCGGARQSPVSAVPDASARITVDLPVEGPERAAAFRGALDAGVCLLRTGDAAECHSSVQDRVICNTRDEAAIRTALLPLFDALPAVQLQSPFAAPDELRQALPEGAEVTMQVLDARRAQPCRDWGAGACAAVRYDDLWLLLGKTDVNRPGVHRIELYPAERVCVGEPR